MIPKTWDDVLIWMVMQFPVLGACACVVWWVLRWTGKHNTSLLDEKEKRIKERDERIAELKNEVDELKRKLSRSPSKDKPPEAGGVKS